MYLYILGIYFSDDGWVEFYRGDSFIVWKKEEVDHIGEGLYCYKSE